MLRLLWRNSGPRELPRNIRDILESRYHLDNEGIGKLRLVERSGKYAGRPVRFVRIYDSTMLARLGNTTLKYAALDHPEYRRAIQFDGHVEKQGLVLLNDRRVKQGQPGAVAAR